MPDIEKLNQEAEEARQEAIEHLSYEINHKVAANIADAIIAATIAKIALQRAESEELAFGEMRARAGMCKEASTDPAPIADDGWIKWEGGECPVHGNTIVEVELRDEGKPLKWRAAGWRWECKNEDDDIIAYRIIRPAADRVSES